jgi:predicted amidophosphoribosyltransferase
MPVNNEKRSSRIPHSRRCSSCGRPIPMTRFHCDACFGQLSRYERCEELADRDELAEMEFDRRYRR